MVFYIEFNFLLKLLFNKFGDGENDSEECLP